MPGPSYKLESAPRCPACRRMLDGAFCVDGDRTPTEGDFTVCLSCTTPLRYTAGLGLRLASEKDVAELSLDEALQLAAAIHGARAARAMRQR